jgi:hypothetical protein
MAAIDDQLVTPLTITELEGVMQTSWHSSNSCYPLAFT